MLQPVCEHNIWLQERFESLVKQQQKKERWEKYKVILAIILALALCAVIFLAANGGN